MEEEEDRRIQMQSSDDGGGDTQNVEPNRVKVKDQHVLQFLDSMDEYLTQMDSLSTILRQGWLELASARHSMGASRVNGALLDLKIHSAPTSLRVSEDVVVDSEVGKAHFTLCKWASSENGKPGSGEGKFREDNLRTKSGSPQLRHRSLSPFSENPEKTSPQNGAPLVVDDQVQKERSKSLSVFGTLVSPKLRTAQLSFETALEKLVEIANARSTMLCAFDQVREELEGT
ncbi:Coiled-coil domain-containing protein [Trema orientale]|uniref:Vacuolar ATPase assembly protein VMA22 n=1 Tax=Trema orientale TaxID=63057 RepID=A0A2P5EY57_TREOI|nr:Coiled-coil domain-containing protein [Trema orientale]